MIMLEDGMILYHGSYAPINKIDLSLCAQGKDFGKGFYLTENFEQAKKFIGTSLRKAKNIRKIANDTTNPTIMAYLNGLYGNVKSDTAINFAISRLMPDNLKNQYCFLSERAVSCLELVEVNRYDG